VGKIVLLKEQVMGRVAGKVAIVTGAASGLGAADAKLLALEGASVVLTDVNEKSGREVAAQIPGSVFIAHDVRDEASWKVVVAATVQKFGKLHILVNNAGLVKFSTIEESTLDEFRFVNAVMVEGTFLGCKNAIPAIAKSGGGSIINMSSVAALKGLSSIVAYTAAKGAILSMTRSIAMHCQEQNYGIRCNALVPGAHDTPMTEAALARLPADYVGLDQIKKGQGKPEDVANLVLFLASEESKRITGTYIVIDQGETVR
jgi:3(or 17)beta-hydroxysteroid dehydrogenase